MGILKKRDFFRWENITHLRGKKESVNLFDNLSIETINYLKRYYDNFPKNLKEHGFWHGEQQVKTFLTLALGKITNGYVIQEHPISRRESRAKKAIYNGRVDYGANYYSSSFLIEVKHHWIRYKPKTDDFIFYNGISLHMKTAISQIDRIKEKIGFNYYKNLFGLGLIVSPIFIRTKQKDIEYNIRITNKLIDQLANDARNAGANILAMWKTGDNYYLDNSYKEDDEKYFEYFPGLIFIGKVKKISKKLFF